MRQTQHLRCPAIYFSGGPALKWIISGIAIISLIIACAPREDHPIQPIRDYERMIVGRLDADYIGTETCLAKCHAHDKKKADLDESVHGSQIDTSSGLPLVNCESCHGPGSLAVADLPEQTQAGQECRYDTMLPLADLPSQAQSLLCLKCHSANSSANLALWGSSAHAQNEVSCFNCHQLHIGPQQKLTRKDMANTCFGCHLDIQNLFSQSSHHPVKEHKMDCADCHDPHGTMNRAQLREPTVKATCTRCHMEYQGPFVYEHADVTEDCSNCHSPHGSPNKPLLAANQPFLCLQCHSGHQAQRRSAEGTLSSQSMKQVFFNRCTDCHSSIHGTDIPSRHGRGTFLAR
jgi:DmsE family decaheme c-type cytochrome